MLLEPLPVCLVLFIKTFNKLIANDAKTKGNKPKLGKVR